MKLTTEQHNAAQHSDGHARIVAVAGAGKTATLIEYVTNQLSAGLPPRDVLIVMYNKSAKDDFQQRLTAACNGRFPLLPNVRTFHAMGLAIYRQLVERGLLPQTHFEPLPDTLYDLEIKRCLTADSQLKRQDDANALQDWVDSAKQFIQRVKSSLSPAASVFTELGLEEDKKRLISVFDAFESWRKKSRRITFDDMIYDPVRALAENPEHLDLFCNRYSHILVDEYQDINPIQHHLLRLLSGHRAQVMVIGDPDQTIYEFRGSSTEFITHQFDFDFPQPKRYRLTQTFRFGHHLALAANALIQHNQHRENILTISAESAPQTKIQLAKCFDHGKKIASTIQYLHLKGASLNSMAVLCRLWSFIRPVELELMAQGIQYQMAGEQSILNCQEIKPLLHLIALASGDFFALTSENQVAGLFDILSIPSPKIPHARLRLLAKTWQVKLSQFPRFGDSLQAVLPPELTPYQHTTLSQWVFALNSIHSSAPCGATLQRYCHGLLYAERLKETATQQQKGDEQAATLKAFLGFVNSQKNVTWQQLWQLFKTMQSQPSRAPDGVTLTTIHRSKGLEWPIVFIPNVANKHLPYYNPKQPLTEEQLASERRLMYVAITRAKHYLFLTIPNQDCEETPSRFIEEMALDINELIGKALYQNAPDVALPTGPGHYVGDYLRAIASPLNIQVTPAKKPNKTKKITASGHTKKMFASTTSAHWALNDQVIHAVLGKGVITEIDTHTITIRFRDGKARKFDSELSRPHLTMAP